MNVSERLTQRRQAWQTFSMKHSTLQDVLNPQPAATEVYKRLLDWIHRVAVASRSGAPRPPFTTEEGGPIYPEDCDPWWLTDVQKRCMKDKKEAPCGDEDGPAIASAGDDDVVAADAVMDVAHSDSNISDSECDRDPLRPHMDDSHTYRFDSGRAHHEIDVSRRGSSGPRSAIRDRAAEVRVAMAPPVGQSPQAAVAELAACGEALSPFMQACGHLLPA